MLAKMPGTSGSLGGTGRGTTTRALAAIQLFACGALLPMMKKKKKKKKKKRKKTKKHRIMMAKKMMMPMMREL